MSRKLVAYFSAGGVTAKAAGVLAEAAGADLYEIRPQIPYTREDLDWMDKKARSTVEMNDRAFRPAIADHEAGVEGYDVIFVGFPIWWYVAPTIINTFLESYDFSGKMIVPFCTSHSSGIGSSADNLHPLCSDSTEWLEGRRFAGGTSRATIEEWLNDTGISK